MSADEHGGGRAAPAGPTAPDLILEYVQHNPGVTCFQIAQHFGWRAPLVTVELQELRRLGKVRSQGNTRGTKWFARGRGAVT